MSNETSLRSRIREFFTHNADEYLTIEDVAEKFNCTTKQARDAIGHMRLNGERIYTVTCTVVMAGDEPVSAEVAGVVASRIGRCVDLGVR